MPINQFSPKKNSNIYLYTKGGQYSLNGKNYIGEYHLEGTIAKTGPIQSPDSLVLHRIYTNPDHYIYDKAFNFNVPILNFIEPKPYLYEPNDQAYVGGYDSRYFVEKVDDENSFAIEIDNYQSNNYGKKDGIDNGLYNRAIVRWKLTGKREDIIKHNEYELYKASSAVPTIAYAVKNFLEFAQITLG